jgi:hypothetical protein
MYLHKYLSNCDTPITGGARKISKGERQKNYQTTLLLGSLCCGMSFYVRRLNTFVAYYYGLLTKRVSGSVVFLVI